MLTHWHLYFLFLLLSIFSSNSIDVFSLLVNFTVPCPGTVPRDFAGTYFTRSTHNALSGFCASDPGACAVLVQ